MLPLRTKNDAAEGAPSAAEVHPTDCTPCAHKLLRGWRARTVERLSCAQSGGNFRGVQRSVALVERAGMERKEASRAGADRCPARAVGHRGASRSPADGRELHASSRRWLDNAGNRIACSPLPTGHGIDRTKDRPQRTDEEEAQCEPTAARRDNAI
ncbi:hypothetical protein MRX96_006934 [Rhipicephalus microplus]